MYTTLVFMCFVTMLHIIEEVLKVFGDLNHNTLHDALFYSTKNVNVST
jgi:hypothetical protein